MKTISRYIMTLALLLTAATGAWAQDKYTVTFKANGNTKMVENVTLPYTFKCDYENANGELDLIIKQLYELTDGCCASDAFGTPASSGSENVTGGVDEKGESQFITISAPFEGTATVTGVYFNSDYIEFGYSLEITCTQAVDNTIDVKWTASTKTGTFEMPAFDVEIAPIYAPVAQWAKVENVDQLPTAIEGIYAESTDAIVKAGTVAKIGETENLQGTLMYAVGTSATEQPALTAFSATLPTAKDITTAGDYYVWYYIKGADAPQGVTPTAENTFNDSEICTTPLKVTVLNNKFDIQFKAANANTIEAGKATVTVGGTAATVTESKLEGVKMGSEVKVTANTGYKFRKVEVKKKEAEKTIKIDGQDYTVLNGETWSQFISRNKLSGCYLTSMSLNTWSVCKPDADLHVSSDGTNWTLLQFSPKDAPIDTDKQYKWVTVSFDD